MSGTGGRRESARRPVGLAHPLVIAVWTLAIGLPALVGAGLLAMPQDNPDAWAAPVFTLVSATWGLVGAVVVTRQPGNAVGWLLWLVGALTSISLLGQGWALASLLFFDRGLPLTDWGTWFSVLFNPVLGLAILLLPLRFPDGRLASPRWRIVEAAAILDIVVMLVGQAVRPGPLVTQGPPNPTGIDGMADAGAAMVDAANLAFLVLVPLVLASLVIRFRRGTPVERQQLKWFGGAVALAGGSIMAATVLPQPFGALAFAGFAISLGLIPVAIGVAVLRYRLFEIDRLVGRTVGYAIVTALLAAAFLGTNLVLQALVADATGSSTLITAVSTLVVAALVQPLRRRVQAAVDRRFNRARVDGERVVGAFAIQVRDQVDLDRLRRVTVEAATDAVAPTGATIWLRGAG